MVDIILGGAIGVTWILMIVAVLNVHDRIDVLTDSTSNSLGNIIALIQKRVSDNTKEKPVAKKGKKHA